MQPDKMLDVLVLGSPDANELSTMPEELLSQMNVVSVDKKKRPASFKSHTYERIHGDVFDPGLLQDRIPHADVTLCRWFLHHCTSSQKDSLMKICAEKIPENGLLVIMDWFVPDWSDDVTGFDVSCHEYFSYQHKLNLAPSKDRWMRNIIEVNSPNFCGGKFDSTRRFEERLMKSGFKFDKTVLATGLDVIDDPELFGLYGYVCRRA